MIGIRLSVRTQGQRNHWKNTILGAFVERGMEPCFWAMSAPPKHFLVNLVWSEIPSGSWTAL
jgi:hypothetical protein